MSFSEKILSNSNKPIHFIYADVGMGIKFHWFIMCTAQKYKLLSEHFGKEKINLSDYGVILASGWGMEPSEETKSMLKAKYNFDPAT